MRGETLVSLSPKLVSSAFLWSICLHPFIDLLSRSWYSNDIVQFVSSTACFKIHTLSKCSIYRSIKAWGSRQSCSHTTCVYYLLTKRELGRTLYFSGFSLVCSTKKSPLIGPLDQTRFCQLIININVVYDLSLSCSCSFCEKITFWYFGNLLL